MGANGAVVEAGGGDDDEWSGIQLLHNIITFGGQFVKRRPSAHRYILYLKPPKSLPSLPPTYVDHLRKHGSYFPSFTFKKSEFLLHKITTPELYSFVPNQWPTENHANRKLKTSKLLITFFFFNFIDISLFLHFLLNRAFSKIQNCIFTASQFKWHSHLIIWWRE